MDKHVYFDAECELILENMPRGELSRICKEAVMGWNKNFINKEKLNSQFNSIINKKNELAIQEAELREKLNKENDKMEFFNRLKTSPDYKEIILDLLDRRFFEVLERLYLKEKDGCDEDEIFNIKSLLIKDYEKRYYNISIDEFINQYNSFNEDIERYLISNLGKPNDKTLDEVLMAWNNKNNEKEVLKDE